jgi:hypothetical protein
MTMIGRGAPVILDFPNAVPKAAFQIVRYLHARPED